MSTLPPADPRHDPSIFIKPKRSWFRRWLRRGLLVFVIFPPLALLGVYLAGVWLNGRWEAYAADLRAKGEPLTIDEIEAMRSVETEDWTCADALEETAWDLADVTDDARLMLEVLRPRTPLVVGRQGIEPARRLLRSQGEVLDALAAMDELPDGRLGVFSTGLPEDMVLPDLDHVRAAQRLLCMDTIVRLVDNDRAGALATVRRQLRLSRVLRTYPCMVGRLIEMAILNGALRSLELTLASGELAEPTLVEFEGLLADTEAAQSMVWAFRGERAFFISILDTFHSGQVPPAAAGLSSDETIVSPRNVRTYSLLPDVWSRSNQLRGASLWDPLLAAGDDPVTLLNAAYDHDREVPTLSRFHYIAMQLTPSVDRAVVLHVRLIASLRCARAAFAAERFRMSTGALPASLDQLVPAYLPAVPLDPFANAPLRMTVHDGTTIIYAVGEDVLDDGGRLVSDRGQQDHPDVGFRLFPLERRRLELVDVTVAEGVISAEYLTDEGELQGDSTETSAEVPADEEP